MKTLIVMIAFLFSGLTAYAGAGGNCNHQASKDRVQSQNNARTVAAALSTNRGSTTRSTNQGTN